jgi:hypothetical protein
MARSFWAQAGRAAMAAILGGEFGSAHISKNPTESLNMPVHSSAPIGGFAISDHKASRPLAG